MSRKIWDTFSILNKICLLLLTFTSQPNAFAHTTIGYYDQHQREKPILRLELLNCRIWCTPNIKIEWKIPEQNRLRFTPYDRQSCILLSVVNNNCKAVQEIIHHDIYKPLKTTVGRGVYPYNKDTNISHVWDIFSWRSPHPFFKVFEH